MVPMQFVLTSHHRTGCRFFVVVLVIKYNFSRSNFEDGGHDQEEDEPPPVLDPSHPLLAKFQQALKEHLEQQIEHLSGEVAELVLQ